MSTQKRGENMRFYGILSDLVKNGTVSDHQVKFRGFFCDSDVGDLKFLMICGCC